MKKFYSFLVLFGIIFIGSVLRVNDVSAYYKDNCYAAQWEHVVNVKGDFDQHNIYSTKKLCYSNNKIEVEKLPDKTYSVSLPKYKDVEKDSVTVKYCTKMVAGVCITTNKQTFKLSDYNNDFGKMVKAMDDVLSGAAAPDGYTKIAFDKNDAQYSMEVQQSSDDDGAIGEIKKDCSNQGGAKSLGWVVCPIMSLLGEAAEDLYNGAVEPALRVEPKLFSDANSNVEDAWNVFRNIANVIFVILMLVVIFSQLTGVGIDNYGIKKILPKLIMVAVLINLSYILCVLAVDISNILGNSFQSLFRAMSDGMSLKMNITGAEIGKEALITGGTILGIVVLGELVSMTGRIWTYRYVAIALLVGALGVAISIFFLFILLAAREAAIVVLIVLAPVAVVLYALPNTKSIFNKWLKMFEGLLLVYPIAGLLVGGGDYVSALLLSAGMNDFFGSLTAMIAGILPIFFIPTVLKNSFNALGSLGARISSMGDRVSRGVTGGIRGSEAYKGLQERNIQYARRRRFEQGQELLGRPGRMNAFRRGMMGGTRGIVRTGAQVERDRQQTAQDAADAMDMRFGNESLGDLMGRFEAASDRDNGNAEDASSLARVITKRYGAAGMNAIAERLRTMDARDGGDQAIINQLRQALNDDANFANIMKSKAGDMYDFVSNGGRDDRGNYQGAGYFTGRMGTAGPVTGVADWATQSGATLRAAINSGALTTETINELLNSDVPEVKAALQGDPSKRDILQAASYNQANGTNYAEGDAAREYRDKIRRDAEAEANRAKEQRDRVEQTLSEINQKLNNHNNPPSNPSPNNPPSNP